MVQFRYVSNMGEGELRRAGYSMFINSLMPNGFFRLGSYLIVVTAHSPGTWIFMNNEIIHERSRRITSAERAPLWTPQRTRFCGVHFLRHVHPSDAVTRDEFRAYAVINFALSRRLLWQNVDTCLTEVIFQILSTNSCRH